MDIRTTNPARECRISTYVVKNNKRLGPATIIIANRVEDATSNNGRQQLLDEEGQEDGRDGSQVEVVNEEKCLELEGRAVAHKLATSKDDGVVNSNEKSCLLQGGHGRLPGDKPEVANRVASEEGPDLVKDGP